jgi:CHAT domain-containing protein
MQELNRGGKLTDYRYLLFSAHGYLATNPTLTSLVLSQNQRTPEADGYITAAEWPGYDIRSDLTVFSACDTGVGKTLPGEGVMGLPYALFVAGNKNTLLTLWPVDDAATAEFMSRFFKRLAGGSSQTAALTATKREFSIHPTWSAPGFWAAFVLYGV